ncbi:MAG: sulfite exporter TauE/SafE family protein [Anaerolineales bacterium]|nr:sulfite exporter TauE/SafE family protein [Anaerolineales bacterium]
MLTNEWLVIGLIALVGFLLGLARGGLVGLGPLLSPLLSLVLPSVSAAVGVMLPLLMIADVLALYTFWKEWDGALLKKTLPGALLGVAVGTWMLVSLPGNVLRAALGIFVWLMVAYRFLSERLAQWRYEPRGWHGWLAGALSGVSSAMFNSGAPPYNAYLLLQRTPARPFVATTIAFFAVLNWIKLPGFILTGVLNVPLLLSVLWTVIFIPFGIWVAKRFITRLNQRTFEQLVTAMLVLMGGLLIWQSIFATR